VFFSEIEIFNHIKMDNVKTFFTAYTKDANARANGQGNNSTRLSAGMNLAPKYGDNDTTMAMKTQCDLKRKDSDKYFYIMWHS